MKKIITALLIVSIMCTTSSIIVNASPDTDAAKTQLVDVSDKLKNLNEELARTTAEINNLESKISDNNASIEEHKKQIETAKAKIDSLKDEINENEKLLSSRLREMYKNNGFTAINYISFLFESSNLSDLIDRVTACKTIIKEDKKLIHNLNTQVDEQNAAKDLISTKTEELENLNKENKDKLFQVNEKKETQVQDQKKLEAEKANLTETIINNERALITRFINTINNSNSPEDITSASNNIKAIKAQLTMPLVIQEAENARETANKKLASLPKSSSSYNSHSTPGKVIATYSMQATAYTSTSKEPLTATGTKPVYNPSGFSTIAVDKSIIPLGSIVNVHGYGYAIAADTGSAIKGMIIDVYFNTEAECNAWGRKYNVTVEVFG